MSDDSSLNHVITNPRHRDRDSDFLSVTRLLPATIHTMTCLARDTHHVCVLCYLRPPATKDARFVSPVLVLTSPLAALTGVLMVNNGADIGKVIK
jgi:hypothetical protein